MRYLIIVLLCASSVFAQDNVRNLTKQDADLFARIVSSRETSRENYLVTARLLQEKRSLFKNIVHLLDAEHHVKAEYPYTFDMEQMSLFQISTNALKKGEQPKRTLVKKYKNQDEAKPLTNLMVSRQRLERQIITLAELTEENRNENIRWDEHLRKTFNLTPMTRYQLKKVTDEKYQLILVKEEPAKSVEKKK